MGDGTGRGTGATGQPGAMTPAALRRLVEAMPKAELHLHLDGAVLPATALEIARTRGVDAPRDFATMAAALVAPMPCRDQAQLIDAFDLPVALLQDAEALERVSHFSFVRTYDDIARDFLSLPGVDA